MVHVLILPVYAVYLYAIVHFCERINTIIIEQQQFILKLLMYIRYKSFYQAPHYICNQ